MLLRWWDGAERIAVGVLGAFALLASCYEMFVRYFLPQFSPDWGEEIIVYTMIWAVWLATSGLVEQDRHVRADLVIRLLPAGGQRAMEIVNCLLCLLLCGLLLWFGLEVVDFAILLDERSGSSLRFPVWIYYACLPAGCLLMALRYLRRIWLFAFRYDAARMQIGEGAHVSSTD